MKVRIVCYEDLDLWILGKFARKMNLELNALGIQCDIAKVPDFSADINHHIIYYNYDGRPSTVDTVMITHIDTDWKLQKVKNQLMVAPMGICMSASTVEQLAGCGIPRERLSHVLPAHDQVMRPRPLVIGITSKIHNDGRKRESMLLELADQISTSAFSFKIMGGGWNSIVDGLKAKGFAVEYHESFDYQLNQKLVPTFDYYLYLGFDEGAMGFIDALAAGVKTIATPQGYHLEAENGITHPFKTLEELVVVFKTIAEGRRVLTEAVGDWTWREYALRHLEIWDFLLSGTPKRFSQLQRRDGIASISKEGSNVIPASQIENHAPWPSKRKILIVCSQFWPSLDGSESPTRQLAQALVSSGYYVTVLTLASPEHGSDTFKAGNIISVTIAEFSLQIQKQVLSADYDLCILLEDPDGTIIWSIEGLGVPSCTRLLIQPIIDENGYSRWDHRPDFGARFAKILTETGKPLVVTRSSAGARLMRNTGIDAVYLPNATISTPAAGDFRAHYGIARDHFLILNGVNLSWLKNHAGSLDALQDLGRDCKLVMIGSRSEESGFMEAVQEKRAHRPDILFIPRLSREWMAAAIQAANVVVLAANGEGSPITILEAMSHKKPWLATPEYSEAKTQLGGFTCEWRNLKDYLQALKDHPQWCDELGVVGFEHWRQHHSWPVAVQGWVDLIEYEKLRNPLVFDINQVSRMARIRGELFGVLPEESREPFHEPTLYLGEVAGVDPQTLAAAYNGSLELVRLVEIAQVLTERGELSGVAALYRAWIEHSDSHLRFAALYNLGTVLEGTGDTEGARQAYAGALNFNPKFEMARIALMRLQ